VAPVDATMVSAVFGPLLDAVTARPEVDADRLVAVGYSGGGFLALRATARDPRIRALVADAPIVDFGRLMGEEMPKALLNAPPAVVNAVLRLVGRRNPFLTLSIAKLAWQWGVSDLTEWFALFRDQSNEDLLDDIGVPVLALTGEGESAEQRRQARQAFDALPEPKAFRTFSAAEGAEAHTQVNNPTLMQEVIFGWLAKVLQRDQIRA
jgi:pimeloyl-ACP methyl ester carboxylesterase